MKVSLVQKKHILGDKEANLKIIEESVKKNDSDLYIFPELFLTGYRLRDRLWDEAEHIPGPSTDKIAELAEEEQTSIIFGMPEKIGRSGRLKNSSVLINREKDIEVYRKTYLPNFGPFEEMRYFGPDDEIPVFDTQFGKLGMVICYDIFFPELTKAMALKGADFIVCISASPSISKKFFETVLPARAIETTAFTFYANLLGREENFTFWGGNRIISPTGLEVAKAPIYEEDVLTVEIDLEDLDRARKGRPVLGDTRTEVMYASADSIFID